MSISRRRFLESTALGGIAAGVTNAAEIGKDHKLPTRVLGKTGARVSIVAFGGGSRFAMYKEEEQALAAVNHALDLGITYMDTAYGYGKGQSEERIGKVMKTRRKSLHRNEDRRARRRCSHEDSGRQLEAAADRSVRFDPHP